MKNQHTPGPWRTASTINGDEYALNVLQEKPDSVFSVVVARAEQSIYINGDTAEANAKLIAAAPELLAALTDLYLWVKHMEPGEKPGYSFDNAYAIIKKATQ